MVLRKAQKEAVLKWIGEGLDSGEINQRAQEFDPPFSISKQQVSYYRKTRQKIIKAIQKVGEFKSLQEGLSQKEVRVEKLQQLAALIEQDLLGGFLWLEDVKSVGGGKHGREVEFEKFNKAEVDAYINILDDIAKEMGDRSQKHEHTGEGGGPIEVTFMPPYPDDD